MTTRAERLALLCRDLAVEEKDNKEEKEVVTKAEGVRRFHILIDSQGTHIAKVTTARLQELAADYPQAIEISVSAGAWTAPLITAGTVTRGAGADLKRAAQLDRCTVRIEIDKEKLAASAFEVGDCHILYYIFLDALCRLLDGVLPVLDTELFADRHRPTLVLVSSAPEIDWDGPMLTIAGEEASTAKGFAERLRQRCAQAQQSPQRRRLDGYHETATSALSWIGFRLTRLTPVHFLGRTRAGEQTARIREALARQVIHAVIVFTAQRTQLQRHAESGIRTDRLTAFYENEDQVVAIELGQRAPDTSSGQLVRLALWPYGGAGRDRLLVFGKVVARTLEPSSAEEMASRHRNYEAFLDQTARLLSDATWSYRTLVGRRIDDHFAAMRRAEENAADVARTISRSLDTVTRGLSETLLTTVGVVVLTLLAAAVENESGGRLFELAMWAYAVYLVVFPLGYRMGSLYHGYRLTLGEWEATRSPMRRVLSPTTLQRIEGTVDRRATQFRIWFWVTVVLYVAIAGAIWALPGSILGLLD